MHPCGSRSQYRTSSHSARRHGRGEGRCAPVMTGTFHVGLGGVPEKTPRVRSE
jgi:hypothetical protein